MKNVLNRWFLFNPLFILYTDSKFHMSVIKDPIKKKEWFYDPVDEVDLDPFDPQVRQMRRRESYEIERQLVNHSGASELRVRFAENFREILNPLEYEYKDEKTPVALITFVL